MKQVIGERERRRKGSDGGRKREGEQVFYNGYKIAKRGCQK